MRWAAGIVIGVFVGTAAQAACDRCTPDATITTLYDTISVAPGTGWDWPRIRALFVPGALLASNDPRSGTVAVGTIDDLVDRTQAAFAATGFVEREYRRRTSVFGGMASVYSSFYVRLPGKDGKPLYRGLHHFQLLRDDGGWRIVSNVSMIEHGDWHLPPGFAP